MKSLNGICDLFLKRLQGSGCIAWAAEASIYRVECIMMVTIVRMLLNIVKDGLHDG